MKERPIIFSGPMVRAIIEGRKTQTRRVVIGTKDDWNSCPYGQLGDGLWVRETFLLRARGKVVVYRADMSEPEASGFGAMYGGWKPAIFMPRKLSRIALEVTDVRAQRLQDISEDDAKAEGLRHHHSWGGAESWRAGDDISDFNPQRCFMKMWDSINARRAPWASNPWVWAISFKRIEV